MKKAFVVDDTKSSRILLAKCLEQRGYSVTTAGRGTQAVELLKTEKYDVVFLDIKMPFMSGTEVFRWMLQNGIMTPVVITTAYATVKNAVECTQMGAVAYLQKPFTMDKFKELIGKIEQQIFGGEEGKEGVSGGGPDCLQAAEKELEGGRPEEALAYLKQAFLKDPSNPEIYHLLGRTYFLTGDRDNAEKFMRAYEAFK